MRFLTNILAKAGLIVDGITQLNTIANATTDTDKFIVSDGGVIKYRTGAEILSDIGAQPAGSYVPTTRTITVDGQTFDLSANRVYSVLPSGGAAGQILAKIDATSYNTEWIDNYTPQVKHIVKLGVTMNKGTAVYVSGADGTNMIVSKASYDSEVASSKTLGIIATAGAANDQVFVITEGLLAGIDTSTANAGDPVWLGANGTLLFGVANKPVAPFNMVYLGVVTRVQSINGEIFVKVQNGYELNELHDVSLPSYISNGVLYRDTITNLWKHATIGTLLGYNPVNPTRTLTINGVSYDLSADRTWNVGTVTSVGVSVPTGLSVSNSPVTGSGTIAIAFSAGYSIPTTASQANWDTAYNNRITSLTTTGTSGAATLISNVLNIPQYQAQGNYITSLTGEATASGPGAASVTLSNSAVTGKVLTGLSVTGGSIASTDSILQAFGKVQNQINSLVGGLKYQGTWNASTNTPTLTSGVGTDGNFYIVSVAGSTNIDGINDWQVGDWIVFHSPAWQKIDNTDSVTSVNGFTGAVTLTTTNISEGTNLYYTDSRARAAITLTTTGSSGAATYSNSTGVLNVPQYTLAGLGGVPTSRQLTINGVAYDLSADRSWTISVPVTSVSGTGAGISVSPTTGNVVISNTGVTSNIAGTGISVSGATGAVTITNTGVTSLIAGTGISVSGATGGVTVTNAGVVSLNGLTGALSGFATQSWVTSQGYVTGGPYLALAGGTMSGDIITSGYRVKELSSTNKGIFIGNWSGAGYWGLGSGSGSHELRLDQVNSSTGAWENATDVNLYLGTRLVLNSSNYNSYAPTLTGGGASGTWAINITGNAATATNADTLDGYHASAFQLALTNPVTGTGTSNYLARWTSSSTISTGTVQDDGTYVGIGTAPTSSYKVDVSGNMRLSTGTHSTGYSPYTLTGYSLTPTTFNVAYLHQNSITNFDGLSGLSVNSFRSQNEYTLTGSGASTLSLQPFLAYPVLNLTGANARVDATGFTAYVWRTNPADISTNGSNRLRGAYVIVGNRGGNGITAAPYTNTVVGYQSSIENGGGTVNNMYGIYTYSWQGEFAANSTTNNLYGVYQGMTVGAASGGSHVVTNFYAFYQDTPNVLATGSITNRWGLYFTDASMPSYHAGNLLVGTSTNSGYKLDVNGTGRFKAATTAANLGGASVIGAGEFMSTGSLSGLFFENRSGGAVTNNSNWYGWYATSSVVRLYNGSTDIFSINGSTGAVTCSSLTETSSRKIKENIVSLDGSLDKIEMLNPVSYNRIGSTSSEIGLIAEEVGEVYPEFVQYDQDGNPVGVHYSRLTAVLIESVKELKKEINELKSKN